MGSSLKSSSNYNQRGNGTNIKPYVLIMLLAFGAAILGVMVLHKLREKRIFTLLVKEKDHELLTLHLLFQREKEFNHEARKKIEEMKNKVYSLRTQKLELDRRQIEMESTISALKDERKMIEMTLEDKKHEIQMLTAAMNSSAGDPTQVKAFKSMLKVKDREIADLKLLLRRPGKKSETSDSTAETSDNGRGLQDLQLSSDSVNDSTKRESRTQNDGVVQREDEHLTDVEPQKLSDGKDATAMERELVSYTQVQLTRENNGNKRKEWADFQGDKYDKVKEEAKEISGAHNEEQQQKKEENHVQESQGDTSVRAGGMKMEKPDESVNDFGSRVRRKHSKGKRREALRNRRLGDEFYSVRKIENTPALISDEQQQFKNNKDEKTESENKKVLRKKDQFEQSGKYSTETQDDSEIEEGEEREKKSTEMKSNGTETEHMNEHGNSMDAATKLIYDGEGNKVDNVVKNVKKQMAGEISSQLNDQEADRKQETMHSKEAKRHDDENEQGNEIATEENEGEDPEDAAIREPEIDRDDISRFSESDSDKEAEETEF